jgi:hypothetical protein
VKTDDVFVLHRENRALLNGKKGLPVGMAKPGIWFVGAIPLIVTLIGFFATGFVLVEEHRFDRLKARGVTTQATVTRLHEISGPSDSHDPDTYSVDYKYTVNGSKYEGSAGVSWSEYTDLEKGSRIEIRYDPGDPSISKLEKRFRERELERPGESRALIGLLIFMMLAGLFSLGHWYVRTLRPLQRLKRAGRTLRGDVVDCDGRVQQDDYQVTLTYRFTDPHGHEIVSRAETERDDLKDKPLPTAGTPVWVYFVDGKNYVVL